MITITANTRQAVVTNKELLTTGSAGIEVQFTLSDDFNSLAKMAVFREGDDGEKVDVILDENLTCVVPHEVLTKDGEPLFIGIYGANEFGTIIIPTVWASAGVVKPGTEPNTPADAEPTPEVWAAILSKAQNAEIIAGDALTIAEQADAASTAAIDQCAEDKTAAVNARDAAIDAKVAAEVAAGNSIDARDTSITYGRTSEAYAVGKREGVDVASDDPAYHNNAKYYAESIIGDADAAAASALVSEGWAKGTQNGESVTSGSPYYHDNADYYRQQASNSAASALSNANSATNSAQKSEGFAVGQQDGADVGSDSPYYHNNASYYATQAGDSASSASGSASDASGSASSAETNALKAEGYAVGKQNGTDVDSGSTYYHNNASYYSGQASTSATNAGSSATSAAADALKAEGWAKGTQNGTAVSSGTYYHDNAKYYKEQAALSATAAAGSASDASDSATAAASSASTAAAVGANFAPNYSTSSTYAVGDYVLYNGALYRCTTAITTAESWTSGHWTAVKVGGELSQLNSEITAISEAVNDTTTGLNTKAPVIIDTASGSIASFSDGADSMPVRNLVVDVDPVQDLHGYDRPWPAGGSKNKLRPYVKSVKVSDVDITVSTDGKVTAKGTSSNAIYCSIVGENNGDLLPLPAGEYKVSGANATSRIRVADSTNTFINSGSAFTFTADGNGNVVQLLIASGIAVNDTIYPMIRLSSVADDTFEPYSNICPISGWTGANVKRTGKNLANLDGMQSVGWTRIINNPCLEGGLYTFSADSQIVASGNAGCAIYLTNDNTSTNDGLQIVPYQFGDSSFVYTTNISTISTGYKYMRFGFRGSGATAGILTNAKLQIEKGSVKTAYEQPGTTKQITFPAGAGTVYGANITQYADGSGKMVVDRAIKNLSTLTWSLNTADRWLTTGLASVIKVPPSADGVSGAISDTFKEYSNNYLYNNTSVIGFSIHQQGYLLIRSGDTTNSPTGNLVYYLATPVEYTLTAEQIGALLTTLYGVNNVWSDTGNVSVDYSADTKLYIEQLTKPTEDDMTADHAISSGTFFMIGNNLYLATSQIAAGGTITPGTNATQISLADALNQLNT